MKTDFGNIAYFHKAKKQMVFWRRFNLNIMIELNIIQPFVVYKNLKYFIWLAIYKQKPL